MRRSKKRFWFLGFLGLVILAFVYVGGVQLLNHKAEAAVMKYHADSDGDVILEQSGFRKKAIIRPKEGNVMTDQSIEEEKLKQSPLQAEASKLLPPLKLTIIRYQSHTMENDDSLAEAVMRNYQVNLLQRSRYSRENLESRSLGYFDPKTNLPSSAKDILNIDFQDRESLYRLRYVIRQATDGNKDHYPIRKYLHSEDFPESIIIQSEEGADFTLFLPGDYSPDNKELSIKSRLLIPFIKDKYLSSEQKAEKDDLNEQINQGIANQKKIAITFDDGPSPYTEKVMDIFDKYDADASFFIEGQHIAGLEDVLKRMSDEGFEIGNHTWDHPNLCSLSQQEIADELEKNNDEIEKVTGQRPAYLRPPYGAVDDEVKEVAQEQGMKIAKWTIGPDDFDHLNEDKNIDFFKDYKGNNDVVLVHDVHESTVNSLNEILQELTDQGYDLVCFSHVPYTDKVAGN